MVVYTPHNIHFTRDNIKKISSGGAISVSKPHLNGVHPVLLNNAQCKKLAHAREHKHAYVLNMSKAQLRHNIKHGGGFWDTLKSVAKKVVDVAKPHVGKVLDKVGDLAKTHGSALIGKAGAALGKHIGEGNAAKLAAFAQSALHKGVDHGKSYVHKKATGGSVVAPGMKAGRGLYAAGTKGGKVRRPRKKKGGAIRTQGWPVRQGAS